MENKNIIIYESNGYDTFNCNFAMNSETDLQVLVSNKLMLLNADYTIEDFNKPVKKIKFTKSIGDIVNSKIVILKNQTEVSRKSNFSNETQIKANILNLEFNNMHNILINLNENLKYTLKYYSNNTELSIPEYKEGSAILWGEGILVNSTLNINNTLADFLVFKDYVNNFIASHSFHKNDGLIASELNAYAINYAGKIKANNVQDALNLVSEAQNINYIHSNIANIFNVKDALNIAIDTVMQVKLSLKNLTSTVEEIKNANSIIYDNSNSKLQNAHNVQTAIDKLSNMVQAANNVSSDKYIYIPHSIVSGFLDNKAQPEHIKANDLYSVVVYASDIDPLVICFSNKLEAKLGILKESKVLNFPSIENKVFYIYADLENNGQVSVGFKEYRPYYTHYNALDYSSILRYDNYQSPSDLFHVNSLTMYDSNKNIKNRVYIAQVSFNSYGNIKYLNSYAHGNTYVQNVEVKGKEKININNQFGISDLTINTYFKFNASGYLESNNYNNNTFTSDSTNKLLSGINYYITPHEIIFINGSVINLSHVSADTASYSNGGVLKFIVQRLF